MGEYAYTTGPNPERIKIGTCDDMYYLRADQAAHVLPDPHSVNPFSDGLRYRFPFPDEDSHAPGDFDDPFRAVSVTVPDASGMNYKHNLIQFSAPGLNVQLPCPDATDSPSPVKIHRNGQPGNIRIVQQKRAGDQLILICECASCHAKFRLETLADAEPIIIACRTAADQFAQYADDDSRIAFFRSIADRIEAGYRDTVSSRSTAIASLTKANHTAARRIQLPTYNPATDGDYSAWLARHNID